MYYLDVFVTGLVIILYAYYFLYNVFRRFRFSINRLLTITTFFSILLFTSLGFQLLMYNSPLAVFAARLYFISILLILEFVFIFSMLYPQFEKQPSMWLVVALSVPGVAVAFFTFLTDGVIAGISFSSGILHSFGNHAFVYFSALGFYILAMQAMVVYKYGSIENDAFKNQLVYLYSGINAGIVLYLVFSLVFPILYGVHDYKNISLAFTSMLIGGVINYALSDVRILDFKRFYRSNVYWAVVLLTLFVPSYAIIYFSKALSAREYAIPTVGIAVFVFGYLFTFYRFGVPLIERLFNRGYLSFEKNVSGFFQELARLGDISDQGHFWDYFFDRTIQTLGDRFGIARGAFYLYNAKERRYDYAFSFGEKTDVMRIDESDPMIKCLNDYGKLIEVSLFISDYNLQKYRKLLYRVFRNNDVLVMIPYFNQERRLIAMLALGRLKNNRPYSVDLLSVLDVYRIQMEQILANAIMLEDVKNTQVVEHDRMVVESVKEKLIPGELKSVSGMRMSSLYFSNSQHGGNYFESIVLPGDKLGFLIADAGDAGIDSAMILLELSTVLHNQPEKYDSPEKMLNIMNWVLSTSRVSEKYSQVFYFIYSSKDGMLHYSGAAFNPPLLYDPGDDSFLDLDTRGIPVGIDKNFVYEAKSAATSPGQIGLIYSPGLTAAMNEKGEPYTPGRIKDLIRLNKKESPAIIARKVYEDFVSFTGDVAMLSDVSVVFFKITA